LPNRRRGPLYNKEMNSPATNSVLPGVLHLFVAFDVGEEVDLEKARSLAPAQVQDLPRRRRTPASIAYRPPPLRIELGQVTLTLPVLGAVHSPAEATLFDFGGVSVAIEVPFQLPPEALTCLAGWLADPTPVVNTARQALHTVFQALCPAIKNPLLPTDLSEEYFVFQLPPGVPAAPAILLEGPQPPHGYSAWLAGLLRLEEGPLSDQEIAEALRLSLRYSPSDLFVPDWGVAVLLDHDCEETLLTIEFTNLQLLEYRHIDNRLNKNVTTASDLIHPLSRSWLPFWRSYSRSLRALGDLNVEANELFERTSNVFKLVGDQYLARVHRLLAQRFHLDAWEESIQRKLNVLQGVYEALSDQATTYRGEVMEVIVIFLILLEVVVAIFHH
jgi:hypothetical protein